MENRNLLNVSGIQVYFPEMHRSAAEAMAETVEKTALVLREHWNLSAGVKIVVALTGFMLQTVSGSSPPGSRLMTQG